jgi:hypothetical protein
VQPDRYEVACQEGLGYIVTAGLGRNKPTAYLCIEAIGVGRAPTGAPGGPPGGPPAAPTGGRGGRGPGDRDNMRSCVLPGNSSDAARAGVTALLATTNGSCDIDQLRGIGRTPNNTLIEVSCKGGDGQIILAANPLAADKPIEIMPCIEVPEGGAISCLLSDRAAAFAAVDALFSKESGRQCAISQRRFMLTATTGDSFFEFKCQDGAAYIMKRDAKGAFGGSAPCTDDIAKQLGGCTLTR